MKVQLLETFGNDLMVVNAARVSYGKKKEVFDLNDEKLIKYLVNHKHTSVFRHPQLQFRIECPIYVERQLFKHQVGMSANSISGRYVDFSDTYTTIKEWKKQSKDSKQGSAEALDIIRQDVCRLIEDEVIQVCKTAYDGLITMGVSKEQARTILPLNLNTQFIWTGSLLSFIHLFKLRLKSDAQQETREVVELMLQQVKENKSFKQSLKAFEL
jgi:thymidylate synthase (FAD)